MTTLRQQGMADNTLQPLEGDRVIDATEDTHRVRFFFPMELELFLAHAGFELVSLTALPDLMRQADETTWNVLGVARALAGPNEARDLRYSP